MKKFNNFNLTEFNCVNYTFKSYNNYVFYMKLTVENIKKLFYFKVCILMILLYLKFLIATLLQNNCIIND